MEYKVGEQFNFKGKKYIVEEDTEFSTEENNTCDNCVFYNSSGCTCNLSDEDKDNIGYCTANNRKDSKYIHFIEVKDNVTEVKKEISKLKEKNNEDFRAYKLEKVSDKIYKVYLKCQKRKRELHYNRCLFENMSKIAKKKYSLIIINEEKTGGVLYCLSKDADTIFGKFRAYNKDKVIIPIYQKEIFGIKQISFKITNQPSKIKCGWFI